MTSVIYSNQIPVIQSIFKKYSSTNELNREQVYQMVNDLGLDNYEELFLMMDKDENNLISFNEFYEWWLKKDKLKDKKLTILHNAYNFFENYAEDDKISFIKFKTLIKDLYGRNGTIEEFNSLDKNNNHSISFYEFLDWLKWY